MSDQITEQEALERDIRIGGQAYDDAVAEGDVVPGEVYDAVVTYGAVQAVMAATDDLWGLYERDEFEPLYWYLQAALEQFDHKLVEDGDDPEDVIERGDEDAIEMTVTLPENLVRLWFVASQVGTQCF